MAVGAVDAAAREVEPYREESVPAPSDRADVQSEYAKVLAALCTRSV
jgi:hypothetical protein